MGQPSPIHPLLWARRIPHLISLRACCWLPTSLSHLQSWGGTWQPLAAAAPQGHQMPLNSGGDSHLVLLVGPRSEGRTPLCPLLWLQCGDRIRPADSLCLLGQCWRNQTWPVCCPGTALPVPGPVPVPIPSHLLPHRHSILIPIFLSSPLPPSFPSLSLSHTTSIPSPTPSPCPCFSPSPSDPIPSISHPLLLLHSHPHRHPHPISFPISISSHPIFIPSPNPSPCLTPSHPTPSHHINIPSPSPSPFPSPSPSPSPSLSLSHPHLHLIPPLSPTPPLPTPLHSHILLLTLPPACRAGCSQGVF